MTLKCGFLDCNNPVEKGQSHCQKCDKREEYKICSACRQPEPKKNQTLIFRDSLLLTNKMAWAIAKKFRDKVPVQFQGEIDQLLPNLKLSEAEEKLIAKGQKAVLDFVKKKGGKQDSAQWFRFCSVCDSEFEEGKGKEFVSQNPQFRNLMSRIEKAQENLQKIVKKIKQVIGKEKWEKMDEEAIEELEEEFADFLNQQKQNSGNDNRRPNSNQNDNNQDNSAKITQLQQEINSLREEINDLKNPYNPSPPSPKNLQEKENKLREKEREIRDLKRRNNDSSSNKQPSKNDNSNLALYLALGVMGVIIIILLTALLILQKKKKKTSLNWQRIDNRLKNI